MTVPHQSRGTRASRFRSVKRVTELIHEGGCTHWQHMVRVGLGAGGSMTVMLTNTGGCNHGSNVVAGRAQEPWDLKHHRSPLVILLACKCSKVPGEVILISSAQPGEAVIDPHDTVAVGTYSSI